MFQYITGFFLAVGEFTKYIIFLAELTNLLFHINVLIPGVVKMKHRRFMHREYFTFDLIMPLLAWCFHHKFLELVLFNAMIHLHQILNWDCYISQAFLDMGVYHFTAYPFILQVIYWIGSGLDVFGHLIPVILLSPFYFEIDLYLFAIGGLIFQRVVMYVFFTYYDDFYIEPKHDKITLNF
jgi:hypothetical protein